MGEFSLKRPDDKFPRYRKAAWRLIRQAVWTTSYCQVPKVANCPMCGRGFDDESPCGQCVLYSICDR